MPLIQVTLVKGRSPELLQALGEAVTAATEEALSVPRESVRVVLTECEPDHYFVGGVTRADLPASGSR
jgi:4-oxalocrotonate tautomerase